MKRIGNPIKEVWKLFKFQKREVRVKCVGTLEFEREAKGRIVDAFEKVVF